MTVDDLIQSLDQLDRIMADYFSLLAFIIIMAAPRAGELVLMTAGRYGFCSCRLSAASPWASVAQYLYTRALQLA